MPMGAGPRRHYDDDAEAAHYYESVHDYPIRAAAAEDVDSPVQKESRRRG